MKQRDSSTGHDIIVIGASAGGIEALQRLVAGLDGAMNAAIFVVVHLSPASPSMLPKILGRKTKWEVKQPEMDEEIKPGCIYVAPPDHHIIISGKRVVLDGGPKENRHRPAIDPLFRSAAVEYGPRTIGVVLSGSLDDGTGGLQAIKVCGGLAVVQHPEDALVPDMPQSALRFVEVDHCVPVEKMGPLLKKLAKMPASDTVPDQCQLNVLENILRNKLMTPTEMQKQFGGASGFICPECSGPLWEVQQGKHHHYRCLVGHLFSPESFFAEEATTLERALWVAVKTLEERTTLLNKLAERSSELEQSLSRKQFLERAKESSEQGEMIRGIIKRMKTQVA